MYRILTSRAEISRAQKTLFAQIAKGKMMKRSVGYQGGSVNLNVYWHPAIGIWGAQNFGDNRYWTSFGLQDPTDHQSLSISVEINSPFEGTNRQAQGVFLIDDEGTIHLGHRGRVHLVTKDEFRKKFRTGKRGEWVRAIDEMGESEVLRLYPIDDLDVVTNLRDFANEVQRIKDRQPLPAQGKKKSARKSGSVAVKPYNEEFEGESVYVYGKDPVVTKRRHGKVVNTLKAEVESYCESRKASIYLTNNPYDLLLILNNLHAAVFECKTSHDTTSIQTVVGQLMLYSLPLKGNPKKIAVLPKETSEKNADNLRKVGITVLYYEHARGGLHFVALPELVDSILGIS